MSKSKMLFPHQIKLDEVDMILIPRNGMYLWEKIVSLRDAGTAILARNKSDSEFPLFRHKQYEVTVK